MVSLIAAVGKNRELGKNNQLIFHIKEDLQFFKSTTMGHPILMGRKTFDSIGRPLPGRTNYVASSHPDLLPPGVTPVENLKAFLESWQNSDQELFVIGGAMVYFEALPFAKHLYLTEVAATDPAADSFFPAFHASDYSRELIKKGKENDLAYSFVKYTLI